MEPETDEQHNSRVDRIAAILIPLGFEYKNYRWFHDQSGTNCHFDLSHVALEPHILMEEILVQCFHAGVKKGTTEIQGELRSLLGVPSHDWVDNKINGFRIGNR